MADEKQQNILTMDQYILNPMGKNNAVMNGGARELLKKSYTAKFDNLLIRERGIINYKFYKDNKNQYWAHIKVPSETVDKFYYDVVFKFFIDASKGGENDLFKWNIQFFSNDPAFVYTYAHVFYENNLLIPELKSKMSKIAIEQAAKERNPQGNVGYVKTIYFAYLVMKNRNFNKLGRFEGECQPLIAKELLDDIMEADEKIASRQEEGKGISHRKKKNLTNDLVRKIKRVGGQDINLSGYNVKTSKKVKTIKSGISQTRTTKKVKKK
jgi:hypothetical protein